LLGLVNLVFDFGMQEEFEEHAEKAKTLPDTTTNENKLILYGLYKQATVSDVNTGMYVVCVFILLTESRTAPMLVFMVFRVESRQKNTDSNDTTAGLFAL